jgi:hypothetical protein
MTRWITWKAIQLQSAMMMQKRGSLEEMTGKAWMFVVVIVAVVLFFGPKVVGLVVGGVSSSVNTVSSSFNFPIAGGSFVS